MYLPNVKLCRSRYLMSLKRTDSGCVFWSFFSNSVGHNTPIKNSLNGEPPSAEIIHSFQNDSGSLLDKNGRPVSDFIRSFIIVAIISPTTTYYFGSVVEPKILNAAPFTRKTNFSDPGPRRSNLDRRTVVSVATFRTSKRSTPTDRETRAVRFTATRFPPALSYHSTCSVRDGRDKTNE